MKFPSNRDEYIFKAQHILLEGESTKSRFAIVLVEKESNIPVWYTGLEAFIYDHTLKNACRDATLKKRTVYVIEFLNYLLKNPEYNSLSDIDLDIIRGFLESAYLTKCGDRRERTGWCKMRDTLYDFLYALSKHCPMSFDKDILRPEYKIIDDAGGRKKTIKVFMPAGLNLEIPKASTRIKNRVLVQGYLDLFLYEAKKHDPELLLPMALQSYALIREGEVVNLAVGDVHPHMELGCIKGITLDLKSNKPWNEARRNRTTTGSIKKLRDQDVYYDFLEDVSKYYDEHMRRHELLEEQRGNDYTSSKAPLLVDKRGNPMSVETYKKRVKKLFYDFFLPDLVKACLKDGTYDENVANIESYRKNYPGAHMFRHWGTMYLLTVANLEYEDVSTWRGDKSLVAILDYVHVNEKIIQLYRECMFEFQEEMF